MTIIEVVAYAVTHPQAQFSHPETPFTFFVRAGQIKYERRSGGYMRTHVYTLDVIDVLRQDWTIV